MNIMAWAIISNNCWGSSLYQERALPYNTPFVGLWFTATDYLKLLGNLRETITRPLEFREDSTRLAGHPIGLLGDIQVNFLHYKSEKEAREKWERRTKRLPQRDDDLFIKICDRDGLTQEHLASFDDLPFVNKIGFVTNGKFDVSKYSWAVEVDNENGNVPSGFALFEVTRKLRSFDIDRWIPVER